jgi:hypothetical protein
MVTQSNGCLDPAAPWRAALEAKPLNKRTGMRPGIRQGMDDLGVRLLWGIAGIWLGKSMHRSRSIGASGDIADHAIPLTFAEAGGIIPAVADKGATVEQDLDITAAPYCRPIR